MSRGLVAVAIIACALGRAEAGTWDLNLGRLCQIKTRSGALLDCGQAHDFSRFGGIASGTQAIVPDNESFRALMSELGVILAPDVSAPAATIGFGGYSLGVHFGFTTINAKRNANPDVVGVRHRYWRAAQSVSDAALVAEPSIRDADAVARIDRELPPTIASTMTLMARKGFWFPLPSFEIGAGVKHLFDSQMWAGLLSAKVALHEGFNELPLPAFALRGAVSHVFGANNFDLTIAGLDASLSKGFTVGDTYRLTPYGGYQLLWIIGRSAVIDATPNIPLSALPVGDHRTDPSRHFTFLDQSNILRHRFFGGLKTDIIFGSILLDFSYFMKGLDTVRVPVPGLQSVQVDDEAGHQYALNLAFQFSF